MLYYAVRGHVCELCLSFTNYTKIFAVGYTTAARNNRYGPLSCKGLENSAVDIWL